MAQKQKSFEDRKKELQRKAVCPLADGKLFIFAPMMDPYNRRYVCLECPAKRSLLSDPKEWKVYEEDIEKLCCSPSYATVCEWYKKARG